MQTLHRRRFLQFAGLAGFERLIAAQRRKVKITGVKVMIVRGTWDWNLVKIETDSGLYGIGEAYWGPGVKDVILKIMKPLLVGEDPMNVDRLYTKVLMRNAGAGAIGGVTVTAASGIEIALCDLVGRILETPVCNLLGGRFRDKVRFYRTMQNPERVEDPASFREHVRRARSEKFGWTAFKFQGDGIPVAADPEFREAGHDPFARNLTAKDIRRIVKGMETVREELGPDVDFAIECHWRYDVRDVITLAKALEHVKPMWLEDPVPPDNPDAMARVSRAIDVPICTGENLYTRQGFRRLIELQACDAVHIDIPKFLLCVRGSEESPYRSLRVKIDGHERICRFRNLAPRQPQVPASESTRGRLRPNTDPTGALGSCRSAAASTGAADFTSLSQARRVRQSLADVLLFKVREVGQEVANAATGGHRLDDHSHGHAHAADTRLSAHDRRIKRNSPQFLHVKAAPRCGSARRRQEAIVCATGCFYGGGVPTFERDCCQ
jgi:L-alanine-DL-glutamate epimerase-like enolase superfamily enzyme